MEKIDPKLPNKTIEQVKMIDEKAREAGKQINKELIEELLEAEIEEYLPLIRCARKLRSKRDNPDIAIPLTNSLLEREIKEFRRRVRPMDGFSSQEGVNYN